MSDSTCSISVCTRKVYFRGKCHAHYVRVGPRVKGQCTIDGCEQIAQCQKLCEMHYTRKRRHGDATITLRAPRTADLEARLRFTGWTEVVRRESLGPCWEWNGGKYPSGYGMVGIGNDRNGVASRVAHQVWIGEIPEGHFVCHRCDNPPCMNPAHLFAGTTLVNMQDCKAKGRHTHGEGHALHVLTEQEVTEIRGLYATGMFTQKELGEIYGVSQTNISHIHRGETWSHLLAA